MKEIDPSVREADLRRLKRLSNQLDAAFKIPGTGIRIGWDSLLGLIPGVGDFITSAPLVYYLFLARRYGFGAGVIGRLVWNQLIDFVLGSVPVIGDLFDVAWKANIKNAEYLRERIEQR